MSLLFHRPALVDCAFLFLIGWCAAGCSVDDWGQGVKVDRYDTATARVIKLDAVGIHISTLSVDSGMTIGRYSQAYVFPKGDVSAHEPLEQAIEGSQASSKLATAPSERLAQQGKAYAIMGNFAGLQLQTNPYKIGLTVGVSSRQAIRLPSDFDGIFFLDYTRLPRQPDQIHVYIREDK
jgi:hypothetical protein